MKKYLIALAFCNSILFGATEQLIIDAKDFTANDKKGTSTFLGDVKIKMGKDKLNAQKVDIFFTTNKRNKKIPSKYVATGSVDFVIVTKTKHYIGKGNKVIYSPLKEEYIIRGNGFLSELKDNRKIYGDNIYVNQLTGEAKVSGSKNKPVKFIIDIQRGQNK